MSVVAAILLSASMQATTLGSSSRPSSALCESRNCMGVDGRVLRRGSRESIPAARLIFVPATWEASDPESLPAWTIEIETDVEGRFRAELPDEELRVLVATPGFERGPWPVRVRRSLGSELHRATLFLSPEADPSYKTTVWVDQAPGESPATVESHRLGHEQLTSQPGAFNDVVRSLHSLPSVGRIPAGLSLLSLRGLPPTMTNVYYGEHEVPTITHVVGLASTIPPRALSHIDLHASNFPARYGNSGQGLLVAHPRPGDARGFGGHVYVDPLRASASVDGPIGRGSFRMSGQRAWSDLVLTPIYEALDVFGLPVASYYDYQLRFDYPVGSHGHVAVDVIGSGDRFQWRDSEPSSDSASDGDADDTAGAHLDEPSGVSQGYHRINLDLRRTRPGRERLLSFVARIDPVDSHLRLDSGWHGAPSYTRKRRRRLVWGARARIERDLGAHIHWTLGFDGQWIQDWARRSARGHLVDANLATLDANGEWQRFERALQSRLAGHASARLRWSIFELEPGVRVNLYTRSSTASQHRGRTTRTQLAHSSDPRLRVRMRLPARLELRGAAGMYSQPFALAERELADPGMNIIHLSEREVAVLSPIIARYYDTGRYLNTVVTPLGLTRSIVGDVGLRYQPWPGANLSLTAFISRYEDGRAPATGWSEGGEDFAEPTDFPHTVGRSRGLEARFHFAGELRGHALRVELAYAWLRSTVLENEIERPADFDIRHNAVLTANHTTPKAWSFGLRFRVASGSPFTDFGRGYEIDEDFDVQIVRSALNEERLPTFHQLDLRIDKSWTIRRARIGVTLEVVNVYNRRNADGHVYDSRTFERLRPVFGPILPSLGLRCEL